MDEVVVPVRSPRVELELGLVVGALLLLAQITLLASVGPRRGDPGAPGLAPDEVAFRDLPPGARRTARELAAAVDEIGLLQGEAGGWPEVPSLAGDWVSPFTPDAGLRWDQPARVDGGAYLGRGEDAAWLLELAEGLPPESDPSHAGPQSGGRDHRRLADGRILHVKIWWRGDGAPAGPPPANPGLEGWRRVVIEEAP